MDLTQLLDIDLSAEDLCLLDLSETNAELARVNVSDASELGNYVEFVKKRNQAKVAYGGYLEKRLIYQRSTYFKAEDAPEKERNIHLGIDLWAPVGTAVLAPSDGIIHSFQNNTNHGDYGPCIIVQHAEVFTLFGHLSLESLKEVEKGMRIEKGSVLGYLGDQEVNGDYPPHLHFQIIYDLQGMQGDYPGVCNALELAFYKENCPNPIHFQLK